MNMQKSTEQYDQQSDSASCQRQGVDRRFVWLMAGLILFWAFEILAVQHWSTFPEADLPVGGAVKDAFRRLMLNIAGCTLMVCLFRGWALRFVFAAGVVFSNVLLVYSQYFGSPLSWTVLSSQWREGLAVSDHGASLLNWNLVAIFVIAMVVKVMLAWRIQRIPFSRVKRWRCAAAAAGVYVGAALILAGVHKPISRINMGSPEYIYGYTVAWAAEMVSFNHKALLDEALTKGKEKSDVLRKTELPFELGRHVVILQVESLDFNAVEATVGGKLVMPFLNELQDQSMLYSVRPFHDTGSSEADFSLLTTRTPNGRVNPFQIQGFPYDDALPWLAQKQGYSPVAIHGNTGEFFHRRKAYEQMGFANLYFAEELSQLDVNGEWDEELLEFSAKLLNESVEPSLHFAITITSHGPFRKLTQDQREIFLQPASPAQHYLNNMRYVDRAIRRYYEQLPKDTTLVIYGDHESKIHGYSDQETHRNNVPWFICQTGSDLSAYQESREDGLALSGRLSQLDLVCYLRDCLARTRADQGQVARKTTSNSSN